MPARVPNEKTFKSSAEMGGSYSIGSTAADSSATPRRPGRCTITIAASTKTIPKVWTGRSTSPSSSSGKKNGEHRLQTTGDDGASGFEMLQAEEVKRERSQHRDHRENEQEYPLRGCVVGGEDFPGRIDDEPEGCRSSKRPDQHAPAVVTGEDAVSARRCRRRRRTRPAARRSGRRNRGEALGRHSAWFRRCR